MSHQRLLARNNQPRYRFALALAGAAAIVALGSVANASSPPPKIAISNLPLVLVEPTHPQVLLVVPNSQSMDGDLSGAIMTGSGTVKHLRDSTSPVDYSVPAGFSPPVESASGGEAAYTAKVGSTLYDNSASRLNVAKQSIQRVIKQYVASFDFGLMTYDTNRPARYTTWVYYMSAAGGFSFGDRSEDSPPSGTRWVINPCYESDAYYCDKIKKVLGDEATDEPDMAVAASSDDPDINDVLYANNMQSVFVSYGSHSPASPFPPYRTLSDYNRGEITVKYRHCSPHRCANATGPTNAGYVPYSDQVMYAERGFGFYVTSQSKDSGDILVNVAPAATGSTATQAEINARIATFTPYLKAETNQNNSHEIKALAFQSPIAGLMHWADKYYTTGVRGHPKPPSNTGCPCKHYVVMLTDGLPTEDLSGKSWPPLGTVSADGYGVHAHFNLKGGGTIADTDPDFKTDVLAGLTTTLASTNDQALQDTIDQLGKLKSDGVQAYIVGMGAGVDPNKNPAAAATMKAMALAGGTSNYFPGVTPQDVVNDMEVIFAQIQAANQSTTTVAVNSTSYETNTAVYQARFDTASFGWTGDLVAYRLNPDGIVDQNSGDELWDARAIMKSSYGSSGWDHKRLAVTVNSSSGKGVPFRWGDLSNHQRAALETHWNHLTVSQKASFDDKEGHYGEAVLDYLRGDQSRTRKHGGIFRSRSYLLGDIVNSAPLYVGTPHGSYPGTDYAAFVTANAKRSPVIYVGSNDGAVHAFSAPSAATSANAGQELFAFFPLAPFDRLADLSLPRYDSNHQFFVDGSPNAGDIKMRDGQWHTLLVGGLNAGGRGVYAMDITDPSNFTSEQAVASAILWDITDKTPGFSHLGLTYSQPQIAEINCDGMNCNSGKPTFVVIFGSGYNNDDGRPYLYVVNAETGALIHGFDLCGEDSGACNDSLPNGLSTPITVSSTGSTVSDRAYAGDLQGHLWRIDLSKTNPSNWSATVLFTARTEAGNIQPITTQPAASFAPFAAGGGIMVYFGTGRYLGQPDIANQQKQDFYGVLDRNSTDGLPLVNSDLATYAINDATVGTPKGVAEVRTISGGAGTENGRVKWSNRRGWKMNLPMSGERSITNPIVSGGRVVFTTFTPSTEACAAGGYSWLMIVNYAGGALSQPELDVNDDGRLDDGDRTATGENPAGMNLGAGYAAAPTLVNYHQGAFNDIKLITVSGKPIKSVKERGLPRGVLSWSEIR